MEIKRAILENEFTSIKKFLYTLDLRYDEINHEAGDESIYLEDNNQIIGTISSSGHILKCLGIAKSYQGENYANLLISEMIKLLREKNVYYFHVYTESKNKLLFKNIGFEEIISTKEIMILESTNRKITDVLKELKNSYKIKDTLDTATVVMNCNPFTLGHRYLIETVSKRHEQVIIFILEEDRSYFQFKDRFEMVIRGVKDLNNVVVIPSTNYLISALTFPTYFLKKVTDAAFIQAELDAKIFREYFMPIFKIKNRYVGSETDPVTKIYNEKLKEILGEKLIEIDRRKVNNINISASFVREKLLEKDYESIKKVVPTTTYDYLIYEL